MEQLRHGIIVLPSKQFRLELSDPLVALLNKKFHYKWDKLHIVYAHDKIIVTDHSAWAYEYSFKRRMALSRAPAFRSYLSQYVRNGNGHLTDMSKMIKTEAVQVNGHTRALQLTLSHTEKVGDWESFHGNYLYVVFNIVKGNN